LCDLQLSTYKIDIRKIDLALINYGCFNARRVFRKAKCIETIGNNIHGNKHYQEKAHLLKISQASYTITAFIIHSICGSRYLANRAIIGYILPK